MMRAIVISTIMLAGISTNSIATSYCPPVQLIKSTKLVTAYSLNKKGEYWVVESANFKWGEFQWSYIADGFSGVNKQDAIKLANEWLAQSHLRAQTTAASACFYFKSPNRNVLASPIIMSSEK